MSAVIIKSISLRTLSSVQIKILGDKYKNVTSTSLTPDGTGVSLLISLHLDPINLMAEKKET
jgi:hypothetical protein